MLYIFDKDDNFKNIITEDTGLIDTWFKDYQNHLIDEPFVFHVDSESELLPLIVAENQVAFKHTFHAIQQDIETFKLMRIKAVEELYGADGYIVRVSCEPSWLELYDHFIEDRRIENGTAQTAMIRALQGSRWLGQVAGEFGNGSTNFYWIDAVEALFKIAEEWNGTLQDYITLGDDNEISWRIMYLLPRLGRDNGLLIQPDYNAETIERRTLSYPITAMYAQGASLEIEDEEGNHTGGYTRYITFEDVEWKVSNGDPVDKPLGQKWVGDPQALAKYGYLKGDGTRMHRFGHFSNQDYETPEELLHATWQALQENKEPEIYHEATVYEVDKPIFLGDTATILDRHYGKPIEVQSQITGLEYDILRPTENVHIVLGNYKDMSRDPLEDEIDEIKKEQSRPPIINDSSFPDIKPDTPVNVEAVGMFRAILVSWEYDSKIYISHYEVYASQTADFVPDSQFLVYRGRVSSFGHEVGSNETWYYRVRAVNTHGTTSDFSIEVSATTTRIDFIDMEDEIKQEIDGAKDRADEAYDNAIIAGNNAQQAINDAQVGFNKALEALEGLTTLNEFKDETTGAIASIKGDVQGLQTTVQGKVDNNTFTTFVQQTNNSLAGKITMTDAEGVFVKETTFSATVDGLQTIVSNKADKSTVTQLAGVVDTKISTVDANNKFATQSQLTQTASSLTSTITSVKNDLDGLEIGGRNLARGTDTDSFERYGSGTTVSIIDDAPTKVIRADFISNSTGGIQQSEPYRTMRLIEGERYVLSFDVRGKISGYLSYVYIMHNGTSNQSVSINDKTLSETEFKKVYAVFTKRYDAETSYVMISSNTAIAGDWFEVKNIKVEKGNIATDWSPAPEDMATQSQITQLSDAINLRVQKGDVINQINLDTSGVLISGKKLILDGDTTVTGNFRVNSANIASLDVAKLTSGGAAIGALSAISANIGNVTAGNISGVRIVGGSFFNEGADGDVRIANGRISATNFWAHENGVFSSDKGFTILRSYDDWIYLQTPDEVRVTKPRTYNDYSDLRAKDILTEGRFYSKGNYIGQNNTVFGSDNGFVMLRTASWSNPVYLQGERVIISKPGEPSTYSRLVANTIKSMNGNFEGTGNTTFTTTSGYAVLRSSSNSQPIYLQGSEIRATETSNASNYVAFRGANFIRNDGRVVYFNATGSESLYSGSALIANGIRTDANNFYIGVEVAARVTSKSGFNNGNGITYKPIFASAFNQSSLKEYKTNIKMIEHSALDIINDLSIVEYNLKDDLQNGVNDKKVGLIAEDSSSVTTIDNDAIDIYKLTSYNTKAIQELDVKINLTREELILKIAKLENRIIELESAA